MSLREDAEALLASDPRNVMMQAPIREVLALLDDRDEHVALFQIRWDADMQAIRRWAAAHPERGDTWPDRTDMVVWLLGRMHTLEGALLIISTGGYEDATAALFAKTVLETK